MFNSCWASVVEGCLTRIKHWVHASCLLGVGGGGRQLMKIQYYGKYRPDTVRFRIVYVCLAVSSDSF